MDIPSSARGHLRAYLAGGGATAALVGGAIVVFLGVAGFVGFNGLPAGDEDSGASSIALEGSAPAAAAVAGAAATNAVAAAPASPSRAAAAEILAALPVATAGSTRGAAASGGLASGPVPVGGGGDGVAPPAEQPASGILGGAVGRVEATARDLGIDPPGALGDVVRPLDGGVNDTLNTLGGAVGEPRLGDRVSGVLDGGRGR